MSARRTENCRSRIWLGVLQTLLLIGAGCGGPAASTSPPAASAPVAAPVNAVPADSAPEAAPAAAPIEPAKPEPSEPAKELPAATKSAPAAVATVPLGDAPPVEDVPAKTLAKAAATTADDYRESFADVQGTIQWNRDGAKSSEGPPGRRTVYFFNGAPEGGKLVMRSVEDNSLAGPDDQPGVLLLSWQEWPAKLPYSGFAFLGGSRAAGRMILPPLKQLKSIDDLRRFRLSFRFKGINDRLATPVKITVGCRFEPLLADSYAKRIDLGTFTATDEWGSFDMKLGDGKNTEAFLRTIADEEPPSFKIIWSQAGSPASYRAGDTLLIDDIAITAEK